MNVASTAKLFGVITARGLKKRSIFS